MQLPELIAHRGYPHHYPENTLIGIEAALRAGAKYIEVDIQLTRDEIPVLFHDAELKRTTNGNGYIYEYTYEQLRELSAGEPQRFKDHYRHIGIPTLDALIDLLKSWPNITAFIEFKEESMAHFGLTSVTERIMDCLKPNHKQCVPISYNQDALGIAHKLDAKAIGWILKRYDAASMNVARQLKPDFLFCNYQKIPQQPEILWEGPWRWALYEVIDAELALKLAKQGADFIETMEIKELLHDPLMTDTGS